MQKKKKSKHRKIKLFFSIPECKLQVQAKMNLNAGQNEQTAKERNEQTAKNLELTLILNAG